MLLWVSARLLRKLVMAGLSSASFCLITSARRYDSSASTGLPVSICKMPMLLWLDARLFRKLVTAGLSSASFCWITSAAGTTPALARPAGLPLQPADVEVCVRQAESEGGDVGVVVGQFLPDRQRPPVRLQRFARFAGLRLQMADAVVAVRLAASEVGDGGIVVDQPRQHRQRPLVGRHRRGRLPSFSNTTPISQ